MRKLQLILMFVLFISCNEINSELKLNKIYELNTRKTYSYLNESQRDSVRRRNPNLTDHKLEKAGLIKDGKLLLDKFKAAGSVLKSKSSDPIEVYYFYDNKTAKPIISLKGKSLTKEYKMEEYEIGHTFMMAKANIINDGFEEIVTIDKYYIVNGENFDITIWEVK